MENNQPIIVKRIKKVAGGHHGGAWKIAFADFATAMMAFFLVMWLMSVATPEQKKLISGYFKDPIGFSESASPYVIDLGGSPTPAPDRTLNQQEQDPADAVDAADAEVDLQQAESIAEEVERERLELLLQELQNKVDENPQLQRFKDQILFEITQDGLRIQIMDAENRPMFASGSARLQPYFEDILLALTDTIAAVPNKISISGHTDAKPFVGRGDFGNWELSADRANAARRVLIAGGYDEVQVARVFVDKCCELVNVDKLDTATASMAKYWCSDLQCKVMDECVQLFGGYGYMWEYPITRAYADARVQRIYGGTNEIMKEVISRAMGLGGR
jgi:chemotaxis protein MotB